MHATISGRFYENQKSQNRLFSDIGACTFMRRNTVSVFLAILDEKVSILYPTTVDNLSACLDICDKKVSNFSPSSTLESRINGGRGRLLILVFFRYFFVFHLLKHRLLGTPHPRLFGTPLKDILGLTDRLCSIFSIH